MRKHDSFRAAIVAAFPDLERNPQSLAVFIEKGRIAARAGPAGAAAATGFEWRYTLTASVMDFDGDPNRLALAVLDWVRVAQPELLQNHRAGDTAFSFQVYVLDETKVDIEIEVELSEAVDVVDGAPVYRAEPQLEPAFADVPAGTTLDEITIAGDILLQAPAP